jgi:4-amino-4-deoxy-L-arabinose transferase-like glycosyltransferase
VTVLEGAPEARVAAPRLSLGEVLLLIVIAYFVLLKLAYSLFAFPIADEAYYWLWGQHPALSYFDHPPLQGWLQGIVHAVFGRSLFALRLPALLAFGGIAWVLWATARRMGGEAWQLVFLKSLAVYLASPVFGGFFGAVVFNDYLLVALMMGSGWFFFRYFGDVEATGRGRLGHLLFAALLLGLAGLSKYNAAFMGIAVVVTVVARPKLRPLLGQWPIYAAGLLTLAVQAPVLVWNAQHGFGSFAFHTGGRFGETFTGFDIGKMKGFAVDTLSMVSWFIVPAIVSFFLRVPRDPFIAVGRTVAIWTFVLSSATFLYVSNFAWVVWWWNIAAFALLFPFLGRTIGPVMLVLHTLFGVVVCTVLVASLTVMPVTLLIGRGTVMEAETEFGWDEVAAAVREEQAKHGAGFVGANRYQAASKLAFALDDAEVAELSSRRDAFDDWWDASARLGQDAIVLVDGHEDVETWAQRFGSTELLREITIERFGYTLETYRIYLGSGFRALTAVP